MPPIYHVGATAICPHAGQVTVIPTNPRVTVSGSPVATMTDVYIVAACIFNISGAPHPCVEVKWLMPALRVTVMGQPVIVQTSIGLAKAADQAPQGPPSILLTQPRVQAL